MRHLEPRDRSKNGQGRLAILNLHVLTGAGESPTYPIIRKIGFADLKDAAAKGIDDFWVMPTHAIFLAIIYPLVGLFLARQHWLIRSFGLRRLEEAFFTMNAIVSVFIFLVTIAAFSFGRFFS